MAQDSFQERTEEPTPRRIQQARDQGNVARSAEVNSVAVLLFGLLTLYFAGGHILQRLIAIFTTAFASAGQLTLTQSTAHYVLSNGLYTAASLLMGLVLMLAVAGIGVNLFQVGVLFTTQPLTPKLSKLNPLAGFKRFFSLRSLNEVLKSILKVAIVGAITYLAVRRQMQALLLLLNESAARILSFAGGAVFRLALQITGMLLVMAVADFWYQKWQYKRDLRMTRQEVKDERKDVEGDPLVKSTVRGLQRERALQRMMQNLPEADVVVTNPTHLAVALKYDPETMSAPEVVAKGARLLAERIKRIAREHAIPVVENKPLAQSLYKRCELGRPIPVDLFLTVAEIFAYVYRLKQKRLPA